MLTEALENKDPYTAAHARMVDDLTRRVGRRLGLNPGELRTLSYGALLHDIGKIGVRSELLNRPGSLTTEEFEEVKEHAVIGARLLERIPYFADVQPLVRWTHERWDGDGYPDGLRAEQIPLGARIICVCDALDAMISDRPYRCAMPTAAALAELQAHAGSQFDPLVVEALIAEHQTGGEHVALAPVGRFTAAM